MPGEPSAQRLPLDVWHHVVQKPARFTRIVHRQDVGVLEPGDKLDLPEEPLGAERVRQLGMEHLERDGTVVLEVVSEADRGHPALAELALDNVAVGQSCLETTHDFGQVDSPSRSYALRVALGSR